MTSLICVLFFLSGAAALLFETLWFQQAGLVLGNSIWASSLVMAAFMGGLGIGNGLAARLGRHIANPIQAYAFLEILIGATGVALVYGLPMTMPLIARLLHPFLDEAWLQQFVRLVVAFSLLLLPSTAMGATLPLLVKELFAQDHLFGRVLGRLYGWNTLGAVAGAFVGHSLMMSSLGIRGSAWLAAATNLIAASIAGWIGRKQKRPKATLTVENRAATISLRGTWLLVGAGLCGAIMLALEVV
ncbi:MAG: spermidine synthase, partial [Myxococcota bacterium]